MAVRALSIHADYACRRSGACCASGWDIPQAFRRADLLLLHLADPEALARRLSRAESAGALRDAW